MINVKITFIDGSFQNLRNPVSNGNLQEWIKTNIMPYGNTLQFWEITKDNFVQVSQILKIEKMPEVEEGTEPTEESEYETAEKVQELESGEIDKGELVHD